MLFRRLAVVGVPLLASVGIAHTLNQVEPSGGTSAPGPRISSEMSAGEASPLSTKLSKPFPTISNVEQLQAALSTAKGGERFLLEPGAYGKLTIDGKKFPSRVTLASRVANAPATFSAIQIKKSNNIRVEGVRIQFVPDLLTMSWSSAVVVSMSTNIAVANTEIVGGNAVNGVTQDTLAGEQDETGNILGLPCARAMTVENSSNIYVEDNLVREFARGFILQTVNNIQIVRNTVRDLRKTPLLASAINGALIEGNHFFNFKPWRFGGVGDHGDLIYIMTDPRQKGSSNYITIRNNWLEQGTGDAMLGIYLDDNQRGIGFANVRIENNLIFNGDFQGMRLENVRGVASNNTMAKPDNGSSTPGPGISALDGGDVVVSNNILSAVSPYRGGKVREVGSMYIQRKSATGAGWYGATFRNGLTPSPIPVDFTLLNGLPRVGVDVTRLRASLGKRG